MLRALLVASSLTLVLVNGQTSSQWSNQWGARLVHHSSDQHQQPAAVKNENVPINTYSAEGPAVQPVTAWNTNTQKVSGVNNPVVPQYSTNNVWPEQKWQHQTQGIWNVPHVPAHYRVAEPWNTNTWDWQVPQINVQRPSPNVELRYSSPVEGQWPAPVQQVVHKNVPNVVPSVYTGVQHPFNPWTSSMKPWNVPVAPPHYVPVTFGGQKGWFVPDTTAPFYHHIPGHVDEMKRQVPPKTEIPNPVVPLDNKNDAKVDVKTSSVSYQYTIPHQLPESSVLSAVVPRSSFFASQPWSQWQVNAYSNAPIVRQVNKRVPDDSDIAYPDPATII